MKPKNIIPAAILAAVMATPACADGCNISNLLFGKVRIEQIQHPGYETGVIFGNDFDSKRFSYDKMLGRIAAPERDGSRQISDVNGEDCGRLRSNLVIDDGRRIARIASTTRSSCARSDQATRSY